MAPERLLEALDSGDPRGAWDELLAAYAPLIHQVARLQERDPDHVSDVFLFVCERLSEERFRRLRRFDVAGAACFETWLRAVVRNLCVDWRRTRFGRLRAFRSITRLPLLEQETYHCLHEQGLPLEEAFLRLRPRFPSLTREQLVEAAERVQQALTPRQLWLLSRGNPESRPAPAGPGEEEPARDVADPRPGPEALAEASERQESLSRALAELPASERLLVRLRYGQGLTLEQVARVAGVGDPQRADRRIRKVLEELRRRMS